MAANSTFISYRRDPGYPWARLIWEELGDKGVDAFLDLESMRTAGRFDERLLNQIASRPYFIVVLTARTLERCATPDDWMRREIEHAIDTDRIIVPAFIAPFDPSGFPANLPSHIESALSQSQGLTVYSQYLSAATDKLADELLTPVELESIGLTEEDAQFQSRAIREVRSLPPPPLPPPPVADPSTADSDTIEPVTPVAVAAAGITALTTDAPTEPVEAEPAGTSPAPTQPQETTPTDTEIATTARIEPDTPVAPTQPQETAPTDTEVAPIARIEPDTPVAPVAPIAPIAPIEPDTPVAPTQPQETAPTDTEVAPTQPRETAPNPTVVVASDDAATASAAATAVVSAPPTSDDPDPAPSTAHDPVTQDSSTSTNAANDTHGRRRLLVGGVIAAVVIAIVAAVVVLSQGDDEPPTMLEADTWLEPGDIVRSPDGAHQLTMTSAGQLRLQTGGRIVWEPSYSPTPTASAILQASDGNFVVYRSADASSGALWASGTTSIGPNGTLLVIDESGTGFVVIEDANEVIRWREPELTATNDPSTTPPQDTATTSATSEATTPQTVTAEERLQSIVDRDTQTVDQAVDAWVVQVGAKSVGLVEDDGLPWTQDRIVDEYEALNAQYETLLVSGADYNLNRGHRLDSSRTDFSTWYFYLVLRDVEPFASRDAAIDWCEQNRPGDCGVKRLSADPGADSQSWFSPSSSE